MVDVSTFKPRMNSYAAGSEIYNELKDELEDERIIYSSMHLNVSKHLMNHILLSTTKIIIILLLILLINEGMKSHQI